MSKFGRDFRNEDEKSDIRELNMASSSINFVFRLSNREINLGVADFFPGMLLSFSFEPDLLHTSILYYYEYSGLRIYLHNGIM
jgi:hypothetical protein